MSQHRLHVSLDAKAAAAISALLEALLEEDAFPVASFEEDEQAGKWNVSVYVPEAETERVREMIASQLDALGLQGDIRAEELGQENWVERTLRDLAPVRAGRFVVHGSHDAGCARPNEFAILIDAGMAFGTGHHGTTAGCLEAIANELKRQRFANALDLGSGTGVLAIAIAMAARIPVLASDIDPVADRIAAENARTNGVGSLVETLTATGFDHRRLGELAPFDLIVANILAGPLQAMAHDLVGHLSPGGTVILSGLLPGQKARILAAYRLQGLRLERATVRDGWLTLVLRDMRRAQSR